MSLLSEEMGGTNFSRLNYVRATLEEATANPSKQTTVGINHIFSSWTVELVFKTHSGWVEDMRTIPEWI